MACEGEERCVKVGGAVMFCGLNGFSSGMYQSTVAVVAANYGLWCGTAVVLLHH